MNFFVNFSGRKKGRKPQKIEAALIRYALQYAKELPLPEPELPTEIRQFRTAAFEGKGRCRFGIKAPFYFLVYGAGHEHSELNAGYILGQLKILFHLRQINARILTQVPEAVQELPDGRVCLGAIAFGMEDSAPLFGKREEKRPEPKKPFVCHENHERWTEEVLEYASTFLISELQTGVRIVRGDSMIHLAAGKYFGRSPEICRFHAGITLAAMMAAAEELWLDPQMLRIADGESGQAAGPDYLISICRHQEKAERCFLSKPGAEETIQSKTGTEAGYIQLKTGTEAEHAKTNAGVEAEHAQKEQESEPLWQFA